MTRRFLQIALLVLAVVGARPAAAASGSLDPDFGTGGVVTTEVPGSSSANAVTLQGDGKIVVAGNAGGDVAIARYAANGTIETGFGTGGTGYEAVNVGPAAKAQAVGILSNGSFLTVGGANRFQVVLFAPGGGVVGDDSVSTAAYWAYGLAVKPDDGFVMVGEANNARGTCTLVSFTSAFEGEDGFGTNGRATSEVGTCRAVVRLADGRLVVTIDEDADGVRGFGIARFTATGELDGSFGIGGLNQAFADSSAFVRALARQPDGKYVVVGQAGTGLATPKSIVVARFDENGILDPGFGTGGVVVIGLTGSPIALVGRAVVIDAAGNIVVGGVATGPSNVKDGGGPSVFLLLRLLPDGTPDLSFGDDGAGAVFTGFGTGSDAELQAMALQSDGKVVAVGSACTSGICSFALARYVLSAPVPVTTTTIPGGGGSTGCEGRAGFDGLGCLCAAGLTKAACSGQTAAASIGNTFRKACAAVDKASAATKDKKLRKNLKRAKTFLKQASTHTRRQAKKKKRGITADCAASLEAVFSSGRALADATVP
ncbi:MAG TPA: hypothetical protein VGR62_03305 [Candidatus Binatia bacterium]|jgi:uncharacterized delta-60 repeat protein|nr:hypothetical protein [Candidatus Binatia bacterium]